MFKNKKEYASMATIFRYATAAVFCGLLLLTGCGGPSDVGGVEGVVTLDGKPLPDAMVQFQPESGRPSVGMTDTGGHYELQYTADAAGAALGRHTVRISTGGKRMNAETGEIKEYPERVPAKYNTNTELTVEVKPGGNELNFDLVSQ
jgi:hypothetical protein